MKILDELYYGNINPNGKCYVDNKNYQDAAQVVAEREEQLMQLLTGTEKKLFLEFVNHYATMNGEMVLENFSLGFKLGARFGLEISDEELAKMFKSMF